MSHNDAAASPHCRHAEHELWLAMQAAYIRYTNASEALDALTLNVSGVVPIRHSSRETHRAAAERQAAFESYIEARLQFSEVFLSGITTPATLQNLANSVPMHGQDTSEGLRIGLKSRRRMVGVCGLTLCSVALSMAYLMRDPGPGYSTPNAWKETQFATQQTRSAAAPPRLTVEEQQPSSRTYLAPGERRRASAQNQERRGIRSPRIRTGKPRVDLSSRANPESAKQQASSKKRQVLLPDHQARYYYPFTLSPSIGYQRTGPLRLSLRRVNLKHKYFDLSVLLDGSKLDKKHVRLYERVRIELRDPKGQAELVASWIGKNRVHGYIIAPKRQKSELAVIVPRMKRSSSYPAAQASE
jgi:hypothetical protein